MRTERRRCSRLQAFSFLEIVLAVAIMSLALIPVVGLLSTEVHQTRMSRSRILATNLANNVMERLRMEPVPTLTLALGSMEAGRAFIESDAVLNPPDAPPSYRDLTAPYERFVVFEPDPSSGGRRGTLRVLVRWNEDGHAREQRVATVLVNARFPGGRP